MYVTERETRKQRSRLPVFSFEKWEGVRWRDKSGD